MVVLIAAAALADGCATTGTTATTEGNVAAARSRTRPRRRAVNAALDRAADEATRCLPPAAGSVRVTGAFEGESGDFRVSTVTAQPPLGGTARDCVREAFEQAHVDPFREDLFPAERDLQGAGVLNTAATTASTAQASGGASSGAAAGSGNGSVASTSSGVGTASNATSGGAGGASTNGQEGATGSAGATSNAASNTGATSGDGSSASTATSSTATNTSGNTASATTGRTRGGAGAGAGSAPAPAMVGPLRADLPLPCYRAITRTDPAVAGRIRLRFTVTPDGAPAEVHAEGLGAAEGSAPRFTQAMRCIEQRVRRLSFARTASGEYDIAVTLTPSDDGGRVQMQLYSGGLLGSQPEGYVQSNASGGATGGANAAAGTTVPGPIATNGMVVQATGTLTQSAIANVVRGRVAPIRACYQDMLARDATLALHARVRFGITPAGTVSYASSTMVVDRGNAEVASEVGRCIEGVVRTTTFPARPEGSLQEASLPFVFSPAPALSTDPGDNGSGGATTAANNVPSPQIADPHAAQVYGVVRNNVERIRSCYNGGLVADPTLAGRVQVRFMLDATGAVDEITSMSVTRSGDPRVMGRVRQCVESVMSPLRFPAPPSGHATFTLPFDFGPSS